MNNTDFIISGYYEQREGLYLSEPKFVGKIPEHKIIPIQRIDKNSKKDLSESEFVAKRLKNFRILFLITLFILGILIFFKILTDY